MITLDGETTIGERARRGVRAAGPAAFVSLKAHAFRDRGANKDAYDLVYVLLHCGVGIESVADRFTLIAHEPMAQAAMDVLAEDFASAEHLGPVRRAAFLGDADDAVFRQDAAGAVLDLLRLIRTSS